ncbi:SH3 domain-containing protein [Ruegeria sp. Ofav3-42]|uniref:SH3 domain-containing protein n=1 Tax=Ruegeria sp. Ofav3-42 TaxID=2917759 RepID=UPI001EF6B00F|nr:SH3 domain-containing protein [Ruegeria sp. Ofav3-42]MCG7522061.1 SH3 domain-containing protein [Ruegeria sp. Ofav3-42]
MTRLIVITFAALGWCFYVVSGGPDFEPRGQRSEQPVRVATAPKPAPATANKAEDLVTNVAAVTPTVRLQPNPATEEIVQIVPEPASLQSLSGISVFDDPSANITLASLEDGVAGLRQITEDVTQEAAETDVIPEPEKDIREISGTRVNMRDGPGTIYPIIGKATIGQKVEVLSDSGTGWLRLRVLPAQQVGWISASLVRKTAN